MNCSLSKVVGEVGEEDGAVRWEEAVEEVKLVLKFLKNS